MACSALPIATVILFKDALMRLNAAAAFSVAEIFSVIDSVKKISSRKKFDDYNESDAAG